MKRKMSLVLAVWMLTVSVTATAQTTTALDAFSTVVGKTVQITNAGLTSDDYLERVMDGAYMHAPADQTTAAKMAPELKGLSLVTTKDIAVYAAAKGYPAEQVRNKYYRSLANVLRAEMMVNPASEENYKNVQTILSLFLSEQNDNLSVASKEAVRTSITKEHTTAIANTYNVPKSFVEFVVMDDSWNDDNWSNDTEWKKTSSWNTDDLYDDTLDRYDNTPNTPDRNTPNTPNTPDRNTPNTPNTPNRATGGAVNVSATASKAANTPDYNTPDRNTPDYSAAKTTGSTSAKTTTGKAKANTPNTPPRPISFIVLTGFDKLCPLSPKGREDVLFFLSMIEKNNRKTRENFKQLTLSTVRILAVAGIFFA